MAIQTQRYLRKPLYVDAVRVTAANFEELAKWCEGDIRKDEYTDKRYIKVRVQNPKGPRQTQAFVQDWILYTDRGYKVYTHRAFHEAFDLVAEDSIIEAVEEEIEFVPATPESIAQAVRANNNPPSPEGKRVLTQAEQNQLNPDEIRAMVQSGEAVLAQDIA